MVTEPSWCREEFERRQKEFLAEWAEAVRFPTVGADPNHWEDCQACASWYADRLRARGFTAEVLPTGDRTPPIVLAERPGRSDRPTLLIYGHYDVQPADSLEKWKTPPFEPVWREGRLWGRGAQDNKGQLAYLLAALAAMHHRAPNALPPLRLLLEGQEESGSSGLARCLPGLAERIRADALLVCDTFMSPDGAPALVMGLRGIVHFTLTVFGPRRDLHSGTHGGVAPNPAIGLCRMVAALHRPDGAPAVPGFEPPPDCPSAREQELLARTPFDPAEYERQTGVPPVGGERALPPPGSARFPADDRGERYFVWLYGRRFENDHSRAGHGQDQRPPGGRTGSGTVSGPSGAISSRPYTGRSPLRNYRTDHRRARAASGSRLTLGRRGGTRPRGRLRSIRGLSMGGCLHPDPCGPQPRRRWGGPYLDRLWTGRGRRPCAQ